MPWKMDTCYRAYLSCSLKQKQLTSNKKPPQILEYFLTYYMPLLSLWSGIILNKVYGSRVSTDSNAQVENWFKIVKYSISKSKVNIRVGDFVRQIFVHIQDRLATYTFAFHPLGHRVFKAKKRNVEVSMRKNVKRSGKGGKLANSYLNPDINKIDIVFGKSKETYSKSRKINHPDSCHKTNLIKKFQGRRHQGCPGCPDTHCLLEMKRCLDSDTH